MSTVYTKGIGLSLQIQDRRDTLIFFYFFVAQGPASVTKEGDSPASLRCGMTRSFRAFVHFLITYPLGVFSTVKPIISAIASSRSSAVSALKEPETVRAAISG